MAKYTDGLKLLIKDMQMLEDLAFDKDTNLWIHFSRIADLAKGGFYHISKSNFDKQVGYEDLLSLSIWVQSFQPRALQICRKHNFVFNDLDDPWQKLAFTFYCDLCAIENRARQLFDEIGEENLPKEVFQKFKSNNALEGDDNEGL